ncbi:uncharacterized protein LOC111241392 [Vigna radiata var. radiata]|uniref:Uncharacterized protein LOC111241392 n=1 Tax=Vigna radiata var. radiata TaxID=3916 RepID=A0A3Q0ESL0_VIGRR|nr:uncharacterized protein LOC111241392 [Vigna radiata var. radiata]XP_022634733.1 uncharacterized protein LOC111241392 [Vigna radiata var. radiata]
MSQEGEITAPIATQGAVTVSTTGPKPCLRSPLSVIADQLQRCDYIGSIRTRDSTNPLYVELERQHLQRPSGAVLKPSETEDFRNSLKNSQPFTGRTIIFDNMSEGEITAPTATQGAVTVSTTDPTPCSRSSLSVIADQLQRIGHIGSYRMRGSTNPVCIDLERQNIFSVPELDEIPLGLDSNTSKKRKSYI